MALKDVLVIPRLRRLTSEQRDRLRRAEQADRDRRWFETMRGRPRGTP